MEKELVVGTFIDITNNKTSSLNGSEVVFVLTVEDFSVFVEKTRKSNYQDLAILARYKCDENFANEYISTIKRCKAPHNDKWYYKTNLSESIDRLEKISKHEAKLYKSKKDPKFKHYEQMKFKTHQS
tara:strand:- start:1626 stop:2006 length:381 start_codon:yes stop_codon:yes gene_type:complete